MFTLIFEKLADIIYDNHISRQVSYTGMPFAKESPFLNPLMETFEKLRQFGIVDYIWKKYTPVIDREKCKEPKVSKS